MYHVFEAYFVISHPVEVMMKCPSTFTQPCYQNTFFLYIWKSHFKQDVHDPNELKISKFFHSLFLFQ